MYYAERNDFIGDRIRIDIYDLRDYFYQIYEYFRKKGYLEIAFRGRGYIDNEGKYINQIAPLLAPSPEIFFLNHLNSRQIIPIEDNYQNYSEEELFTIIEVIYDKIGTYNFSTMSFEQNEAKEEFVYYINNILKLYSDGYMIEKNNGYIMRIPNKSLINLLEDTLIIQDETVLDKLNNAMEKYYRFNSTLEDKKSSILILAGILEPLREELKVIFGERMGIRKNVHDSLIFEIVNKYDIRHNEKFQKDDYNKPIWYDWMMQYYTSVIVTYYKLKLE